MSPAGNEKSRKPDRCRRHRREGTVQSRTRKALYDPGKPYRLAQHECGEGCGRGLGWEFHGPRGEFRSGGGKCRDERVLGAMELAERGEEHTRQMAVVLTLAFAGVLAGVLLLFAGTTWGTISGISAISISLAAAVLKFLTGPTEEMPELD